LTNLIPSAEYGIAIFAIAGLFYITGKGLDVYCKLQDKQKASRVARVDSATVVTALDNNTRVIESVVATLTVISDRQIKTTAMVEEIVDKTRRNVV